MDYRIASYLRSTKQPDRHANPAAPACYYRSETKRQRRAKLRAVHLRQIRSLKYTAALALGLTLHAQELPQAPKPHILTVDRALYAADLTLRVMDTTSTHALFNDPCACHYEIDPIAPGGKGWGHVSLFQAGMFLAVAGSAEVLRRHHHPRIARIVMLADIADEVWAVQNNMRISTPPPAPVGHPFR